MTRKVTATLTSDTTVWEKIRDRIRGVKNAHVKVGVLSGETEDGDFSLAELAAVHEFGAPSVGIPERSFIRSTFRERASELKVVTEHAAKSVLEGKSVHDALARLGLWGATAVKAQITDHRVVPPTSDATNRRKNRRAGQDATAATTTLLDTGQLKNAISYEVEGAEDE